MLVRLRVSCLKLSKFTYIKFRMNSVHIFHDETRFGPQVSSRTSTLHVAKMVLRKAPYK
jgi:hypothetical protein